METNITKIGNSQGIILPKIDINIRPLAKVIISNKENQFFNISHQLLSPQAYSLFPIPLIFLQEV